MEDTDWPPAVIPANILQGPHLRYTHWGHWRSQESYQLLSRPMETGDVRTRPQHNAGPGVNTGKATFRPERLEPGIHLGSLSFTS